MDAELQEAKSLIQQKRYDDARALLITIDHPTADKWLEKLNSVISTSQVSKNKNLPKGISSLERELALQKSFTDKLLISIVLLLIFFIPGVIAVTIFANEAEEAQRIAGKELPGAKSLIKLKGSVYWLLNALAVLFVFLIFLTVLLTVVDIFF